jgi:hypothetical protein
MPIHLIHFRLSEYFGEGFTRIVNKLHDLRRDIPFTKLKEDIVFCFQEYVKIQIFKPLPSDRKGALGDFLSFASQGLNSSPPGGITQAIHPFCTVLWSLHFRLWVSPASNHHKNSSAAIVQFFLTSVVRHAACGAVGGAAGGRARQRRTRRPGKVAMAVQALLRALSGPGCVGGW